MKYLYKIVISLIIIFSFSSVQAQTEEKENIRHYEINETTISANKPIEKTSIGSKVTQMDSTLLIKNKANDLATLLTRHSTINIKSLGQGALSTASFRGTSSNHTQVLWNGISLNSASLGSFDFSQVPVYFTDKVTLYHGSSAQQSGSGALGGSVDFGSNDKPVTKPYFSLLSEYGSNNTATGAGTIRFTKKKLTSSTKGYYQQSDNDYRYLNKVFSNKPFYENRKNAAYKQGGVMQELFYNPTEKDKLNLMTWYQYDNKELPQNILSNTTAKETLVSNNVRIIGSYQTNRGINQFKLTMANLWGKMNHKRNFGSFSDLSKNKNNSFVTRIDYRIDNIYKWDLGLTANYRNDMVKSSSYDGKAIHRNTYTARGFAMYRITPKLHFDLDATAECVDKKLYGIYNISGRYFLINQYLILKASNAYNHRTPTLNDLYWAPGGNPNLKPETGFSWDASISSSITTGIFDLYFEALYYHMNINDWIMWIPTDNGYIWSPVNFSKVNSQGSELTAKMTVNYKKTNHILSGNYTFAHSVDNSNRGDDAQGKQLPYIPRNKWNIDYEFWYNNTFWINANCSFTDIRFTSADEEYHTNAYYQLNAEIGCMLSLKSHQLKLSCKLDNILNSYYESTQYYPMPLRMWRLQLNYVF